VTYFSFAFINASNAMEASISSEPLGFTNEVVAMYLRAGKVKAIVDQA